MHMVCIDVNTHHMYVVTVTVRQSDCSPYIDLLQSVAWEYVCVYSVYMLHVPQGIRVSCFNAILYFFKIYVEFCKLFDQSHENHTMYKRPYK